MSETQAVRIDGSHGEGGGQTLRTSLSLSVLTGRPVEISSIRAGRSKPGLQPQHLAAVRAAAAISAARTEGVEPGSTRLLFAPQSPAAPGVYHFEIGTAGAATLVAQTVLLPLARAGASSRVAVVGGTHVPHAPSADYLSEIYVPTLSDHGLQMDITVPAVGFLPRGGGRLEMNIRPSPQGTPVELTGRGPLRSVTATVLAAGLPPDVAMRGTAALREKLGKVKADIRVTHREAYSLGPGAAVFLTAEDETGWRTGFSALGARGKPIEAVAGEAVAAFDRWHQTGAACEEHLADQLVLPMALTSGRSRWTTSEVTEHLRTVLWVVPQFLDVSVLLEENADGSGTVILRGVSL